MRTIFTKLGFLVITVFVLASCHKAPTASFTYYIDYADGKAHVYFTNTSSSHTSRSWYFGDYNGYDSYSSNFDASHTYTKSGTYTVSLTVYNDKGKSDYVSASITIDIETGVSGGGNSGGGGGGGTTPTYTTMQLNKITIKKFPTTSGGTDWDVFEGGPDIFFEIYKNNYRIYTSSTNNDVETSDLPIYWTLSNVSFALNNSFSIKIYDRDDLRDELMLSTTAFSVSNTDFPYSYTSVSYEWNNYKWEITFNYRWY